MSFKFCFQEKWVHSDNKHRNTLVEEIQYKFFDLNSLVGKLFLCSNCPLDTKKMGFLLWDLKKQIKSALKKLHNLPHNIPFLLHNFRSRCSRICLTLSEALQMSGIILYSINNLFDGLIDVQAGSLYHMGESRAIKISRISL